MSGLTLVEEAYVRGLEEIVDEVVDALIAVGLEGLQKGWVFSPETLEVIEKCRLARQAFETYRAKEERS